MALQSLTPADQFADARSDYRQYPRNAVRRELFDHALESFQRRLGTEHAFDTKHRSMFLYDVNEDGDQFQMTSQIKDIEDLETRLDPAKIDPWWRFAFIHASSARAPLGCTRDELSLILAHHQVMPAFLDLVLTIKSQEDALLHAMFRHENYLEASDPPLDLPDLGRSGVQVQHAFRLLAIEKAANPRSPDPWSFRHASLYHSFDIKVGRCVWVLLKGNKLLTKRISKETESSAQLQPSALRSKEQSFLGSLRIHLIVLEWCVENLTEYIDDMEKQITRAAMDAKNAAITEITQPEPLAANIRKNGTFYSTASKQDTIPPASRQQSSNPTATIAPTTPGGANPRRTPGQAFVGIFRKFSGLINDSSNMTEGTPPPTSTPQFNPLGELDARFSFERRQNLGDRGDELERAILMIDQNKGVIDQIREQYLDVTESYAFKKYIDMKDCGRSLSNFHRRVRAVEKILDMHRCRLVALSHAVENDKQMFESLNHYANTRLSKAFQIVADTSTKEMMQWTLKMHDIAVKTKQETLSMHVITVFTLIFLPGTFLATFFSSGVFHWDEDGKLGQDWVMRRDGIKLFMAICIPMMAAVVALWVFLVWRQRSLEKRKRTDDMSGSDEEKGVVPPPNEADSDGSSIHDQPGTGLGISSG